MTFFWHFAASKDKKEYVQQAADNEYRPKLLYVVEKRDEMPGLPKRKRAKENLDKNKVNEALILFFFLRTMK